jgi:hypothetical protein
MHCARRREQGPHSAARRLRHRPCRKNLRIGGTSGDLFNQVEEGTGGPAPRLGESKGFGGWKGLDGIIYPFRVRGMKLSTRVGHARGSRSAGTPPESTPFRKEFTCPAPAHDRSWHDPLDPIRGRVRSHESPRSRMHPCMGGAYPCALSPARPACADISVDGQCSVDGSGILANRAATRKGSGRGAVWPRDAKSPSAAENPSNVPEHLRSQPAAPGTW